MRSVFLGLILTLIFGIGAANAGAQNVQQVSVRVKTQKSVMRDRLRIRVVAVEDSRCPADANCVWAGNAKVTVRVTNRRGKAQSLDLSTDPQGSSASFDGYEITLRSVTPQPRANVRINPNGYTASFTVRKL